MSAALLKCVRNWHVIVCSGAIKGKSGQRYVPVLRIHIPLHDSVLSAACLIKTVRVNSLREYHAWQPACIQNPSQPMKPPGYSYDLGLCFRACCKNSAGVTLGYKLVMRQHEASKHAGTLAVSQLPPGLSLNRQCRVTLSWEWCWLSNRANHCMK